MDQNGTATRLRIKIGQVEVEYEGADEFLRTELPELLKAVVELHSTLGQGAQDTVTNPGGPISASTPSSTISASTVAATIGGASGSDLALAAAAALVLGEGKESFSRSQLLDAMKAAKAYYKSTYRSNLSNYINTLVKNQDLLDHGSDNFGLHEKKRSEIAGKLGLAK